MEDDYYPLDYEEDEEDGDEISGSGQYDDIGSGYEDPDFSNGVDELELNNQLLTSTRATEHEKTENIYPTQANTQGRQPSNCQDQKIWCKFADCSLENVKRNCQKTCNLC